jgi:hypothetical protein
VGRTPKEVFETFRAHISGLLNRTVTDTRLALVQPEKQPTRAFVDFKRSNEPIAAPLFKKGLFLYIGQVLIVEQQQDKTWKLKTTQYAYRIQASDNPKDNDCLRWEYVSRKVRDKQHCRNHFQTPITFSLGKQKISLEDSHLPTGWVTIEEIIRFLITDMGVPPKQDGWDDELKLSEAKFREWTARELD